MSKFTSSVSPKGQITIPIEIRNEFEPKDSVSFNVVGDVIQITGQASALIVGAAGAFGDAECASTTQAGGRGIALTAALTEADPLAALPIADLRGTAALVADTDRPSATAFAIAALQGIVATFEPAGRAGATDVIVAESGTGPSRAADRPTDLPGARATDA
ncbi:hypothetical protein BH23CHL4_BH23CHL4_29570 [soil metagenome]